MGGEVYLTLIKSGNIIIKWLEEAEVSWDH